MGSFEPAERKVIVEYIMEHNDQTLGKSFEDIAGILQDRTAHSIFNEWYANIRPNAVRYLGIGARKEPAKKRTKRKVDVNAKSTIENRVPWTDEEDRLILDLMTSAPADEPETRTLERIQNRLEKRTLGAISVRWFAKLKKQLIADPIKA